MAAGYQPNSMGIRKTGGSRALQRCTIIRTARSRALWYHDHSMGINRLNIYAGMFGHYLVRDSAEAALQLPSGEFEVPLVVVDRFLDRECQLYYPVSGDAKSPWVPEVFGNVILVNGKILPYLDVAPRVYRFRVLNASNGRHYYLSFLNGEEFYQIGSDQGLLEAPVPLRTLAIAPGERADLLGGLYPVQWPAARGQE